MNFALVSRLLSTVMLILALAFAVCLGLSGLLDKSSEFERSRNAFLLSIGVALTLSWIFYYVGRGAPKKFFQKEALCVIGLGWILSSVVGSIPYLVITPQIGFANAIFESTSGLTTTGASVLSNLEELPHSLLFWRAMSQWIGGMGVVVFFVAILNFLGASAKMLYANEASGSLSDIEEGRVQRAVLRIVYVYAGLSLLCALAYHIGGMNWFDAVCHMFTTVSTGGFSTRTASFAAFESPLIEWIAIVFMILGSISFFLLLQILKCRFSNIKKNTEFKAYLIILSCSIIAVFGAIYSTETISGFHDALRGATFQVVSIVTTSGFATEDFASWPGLPQAFLLILMTIGGCSGSTSGGIKVVRFVVCVRMCLISVERSIRTRVIRQVKINNRGLNEQAAQDIIIYSVLTFTLLLASILIISIFENKHQLDTIISAAHACFFNIGPGFKEVGPTQTYDFLHDYTKIFLSLTMIMGRLELYAILALFSPSLWKRFK